MYSKFTSQLLNKEASFDFVAAHFACEQDKFSTENPNGFVNFGSAQNFLSKPDIQQRLGSLGWRTEDTPYCSFAGTAGCRSAIANYLEDFSERPINPDHIVVGNGIISILEALSIAILDAGDSVLATTPIFPGLVTALSSRTEADFIPLKTSSENRFQLSPEMLKAKLEIETSRGKRIKAVLLCSPGNPIGQVFSANEIQEFIDIAEEFHVALIVDEIYASSVFEGTEFSSALMSKSENVIVLGGLSKDFGVAGYTTGWICTTNENILAAMKKQSHFFRLAAPIQRAIEIFLDPTWRVPFLKQNRSRLAQNFQEVCEVLNSAGVSVTPAEAGLVSWLDLTPFLKSQDEEGQLELYRYLLQQHRVHLSPAVGFHCAEPGFFRICFSQQQETLREGLSRIKQGLSQFQSNNTNQILELNR